MMRNPHHNSRKKHSHNLKQKQNRNLHKQHIVDNPVKLRVSQV
jgi:hypothetical protein